MSGDQGKSDWANHYMANVPNSMVFIKYPKPTVIGGGPGDSRAPRPDPRRQPWEAVSAAIPARSNSDLLMAKGVDSLAST